MQNDYLPIGSVVQLAGMETLVMISGYLPVDPDHPNNLWDYSGFRFPLGFDGSNKILCFNSEQIATILAYGYRDLECDLFLNQLVRTRKIAEEAAQNVVADSAINNRERVASEEHEETETPKPSGEDA